VIDEVHHIAAASYRALLTYFTPAILLGIQEIITDVRKMKALAFCVSKKHAQYMTEQLLLKGIKADILTSDNTTERQQKQQDIRSGNINVLCVVDIFNEGVAMK